MKVGSQPPEQATNRTVVPLKYCKVQRRAAPHSGAAAGTLEAVIQHGAVDEMRLTGLTLMKPVYTENNFHVDVY
ncbi:uncharacterized protein V6R79_010951 [Siganus canaliculatus]